MNHRSNHRGFTLIELLVVVTIIVVLLALLVPAMDKAIREATYAADAVQIRTIAMGATMYGSSNKQYYPYRPGVQVYNSEPKRIAHEGAWDDRVRFEPYFPLKAFQDPFLPLEVDWSVHYKGQEPPTSGAAVSPKPFIVWSTYTLLFGVKYTDTNAGAGMMKIGQSFGWGGEKTKVMVADMDDLWQNAAGWGSHEPTTGAYIAETGNGANHAENWTISRWTYQDIQNRGTLDNQFALTDGTVARYTDLQASSNADNHDDRLMSFPIYPNNANAAHPASATRVPIR